MLWNLYLMDNAGGGVICRWKLVEMQGESWIFSPESFNSGCFPSSQASFWSWSPAGRKIGSEKRDTGEGRIVRRVVGKGRVTYPPLRTLYLASTALCLLGKHSYSVEWICVALGTFGLLEVTSLAWAQVSSTRQACLTAENSAAPVAARHKFKKKHLSREHPFPT